MARKGARGAGTIRKKTVTHNGKLYTYWEARITTGRNPGTGKQVQRSITGKTQREVREKMQAVAVAVDAGTYTPPEKMTVGEWLDVWARDYLGSVKPSTAAIYRGNIKNHIKPALGAVRLYDLHPHTVQALINRLGLAPSSVRLAYKVLYMALEKAVALDYIPKNPAEKCELPRSEPEEVRPLDDEQVAALLNAARGTAIENLVQLALFTGARLSELLGLTWDCVGEATITINKQLARVDVSRNGPFLSPKNGKTRTLTPAPFVMDVLKKQRRAQTAARIKAGVLWDNAYDLVFTTDTGAPLGQDRAGNAFRAALSSAGLEGVRFHDLRHTYAVNAIRAGDDIKTVQGNLGHASAAFTLDRYGHFTERMKQDSAERMERFIKTALNL